MFSLPCVGDQLSCEIFFFIDALNHCYLWCIVVVSLQYESSSGLLIDHFEEKLCQADFIDKVSPQYEESYGI